MDLFASTTVLLLLSAVVWLAVRSPRRNAVRHRRTVGRVLTLPTRDRDYLPADLLLLLALHGLVLAGESTPLEVAVVLSVLVALIKSRGPRVVVEQLLGIAALALTLLSLWAGGTCEQPLDGPTRLVVISGFGVFLIIYATARVTVAPLRPALGRAPRANALALFGVLQTGAFVAELTRAGSLDLSTAQWSTVAALVVILAFALALLPTFTTVVVAVGTTVAALLLVVAPGSCASLLVLASMTLGYLLGAWVRALIAR